MKNHTSPLILIAAAIFWNNSSLLASSRGDAVIMGVIGLCITGILLLVAAYKALSDAMQANAAAKGAELLRRLKRREKATPPPVSPPDKW